MNCIFTHARFLVLLFIVPLTALAEDEFDVFGRHDETNPRRIVYDDFAKFLEVYGVETGGRVELYYSAMKPAGINFLEAYSKGLSRISPSSFSRQEQLAYWLNFRNILVIKGIASEAPLRDLKRLRGDADKPGSLWVRKQVVVEGVELSISDIENHIILRQFNNPDVIYGLYQGVKGGPSLSLSPFLGQTVDADLADIGAVFVNAKRTLKIKSGEARVPLVYKWYANQLFGDDDFAVIEHIRTHAKPKLGKALDNAIALGVQKFSYSIDERELRLNVGPGGDGGAYGSGPPPGDFGGQGGS